MQWIIPDQNTSLANVCTNKFGLHVLQVYIVQSFLVNMKILQHGLALSCVTVDRKYIFSCLNALKFRSADALEAVTTKSNLNSRSILSKNALISGDLLRNGIGDSQCTGNDA
jgi:hypothetical protein